MSSGGADRVGGGGRKPGGIGPAGNAGGAGQSGAAGGASGAGAAGGFDGAFAPGQAAGASGAGAPFAASTAAKVREILAAGTTGDAAIAATVEHALGRMLGEHPPPELLAQVAEAIKDDPATKALFDRIVRTTGK